MVYIGLFCLLAVSTVANPIFTFSAVDDVKDNVDYKLPSTQIPSHYDLNIVLTNQIIEGTSDTFDGSVKIIFSLKDLPDKKTNILKLHAPMKITDLLLTSRKDSKSITIISTELNNITSILNINLKEDLVESTSYQLILNYTANINTKSMSGLYRSSYIENNKMEYLLATQFEPVSAREAFPCFDEPKYKATFNISISYPKGYNVISNTEQENGSNEQVAVFKETPKMSTYLVAYIVSKFNCTSNSGEEGSIPFQVCSRNETSNTREFALKSGQEILNQLQNFTNITFSMNKMDQIAIPDFGAGAMENWGLVTYRETDLLYDPNETSTSKKQSILTVIAHEFAHQWFGDLVTTITWDDLFLNEGFATYFQYFILNRMEKYFDMEFEKQFIVTQQQPVLVDDAWLDSQSLTSGAQTPNEIHAKFGSISYNKGASIIRMMENILGSENFQKGLQTYLSSHYELNAKPSDLLNAFKSFEENISHIDKWINRAGYPVLIVSRSGDDVILSQNRFLYNGTDDNATWVIPITYSLETSNFNVTKPIYWLNQSTTTLPIFKNETSTWVIFNNLQSAYYRVYYNDSLLKSIKDQLTSNYTAIHVLNRAQLVDDQLNFARANMTSSPMNYLTALDFIEYLKNETEYYPWVSALNHFNFLLTRVDENSQLGGYLKSKVLDLLNKVYATLSMDSKTIDNSTHILRLKTDLIFYAACRFGHIDCLEKSSDLFKDLIVNKKQVHNDLKKTVYCYGLRNSNDSESDWQFLWNKYITTTLSTEQTTLLGALGCTTNQTLQEKYLELSINETSGIRLQDVAAVWSSVYTSSSEGVDTALNYLIKNSKAIIEYYPGASALLTGIAARLNNEEQIKKLTDFVNSTDIESFKTAGETALNTANFNVDWLSKVNEDLNEYLSPPTPTNTGIISSVPSTYLLLFTIVLKVAMKY